MTNSMHFTWARGLFKEYYMSLRDNEWARNTWITTTLIQYFNAQPMQCSVFHRITSPPTINADVWLQWNTEVMRAIKKYVQLNTLFIIPHGKRSIQMTWHLLCVTMICVSSVISIYCNTICADVLIYCFYVSLLMKYCMCNNCSIS